MKSFDKYLSEKIMKINMNNRNSKKKGFEYVGYIVRCLWEDVRPFVWKSTIQLFFFFGIDMIKF